MLVPPRMTRNHRWTPPPQAAKQDRM